MSHFADRTGWGRMTCLRKVAGLGTATEGLAVIGGQASPRCRRLYRNAADEPVSLTDERHFITIFGLGPHGLGRVSV
jgi:hypothetical protein